MRDPLLAVSILGEAHSRRASLGLFLPLIIIIITTPLVTMLMLNDANAAGPPPQPTSSQIQLALRKLGVVGSVLYVAAHPDDENTNLLAYLANETLLRTGYLSITRGDGGQNLIGAEQGTDLGVIRTQELLAARRIDGAEQFFTRALDFGYSKNPDETLRIWDKDAVLADVVWVIRRFRPDVIITRFSPELTDTHGHHTASARLAAEAFHAAADPTFHAEQLSADVRPWQAQRLLWNRSSWSIQPDEDMSDFMTLDANLYNPILGLSYGEMAADSRSMHKSQGFGVARSRGPILEYFKLLDEADARPSQAESILGGIDFSWARLKGTAAVKRLVERAQREFAPAAPYKVIPTLVQLDKALDDVPDANWRAKKKAEVRDLVLACAGVFSEATAADFRAVPGADIEVTASAINRSPAKLTLRELRVVGAEIADEHGGAVLLVQKPLGSVEMKRTLHLPADLPLTTPYWLASPPGPGLFHVQDPALIGLPEAESPLRVDFVFEVGGRTFTVTRPITFKWTDPVAGERYRPIEIAPLVSLRPSTAVLVHPNGEARTLTVRLTAFAPVVSGIVRAEAPAGWSATPTSAPFALAAKGDETELAFRIQPAPAADHRASGTLRLVAEVGGARFSQGAHHIEHSHIPIQTVLTRSEVRLVSFAIQRQGNKIGYIPGPGDEVPASLRQVGYEVTPLGDDVLAGANNAALARFDAIVVGVRAFNTNEKLRAAHAALMAYVQAGGTLVVQYNTNNRIAPLSAPIGPFPFEIGRERVTDETATVLLTTPDHRILTVPNKITERDFDGWIQERGLYFATNWDPRYQTVVSMGDPGESTLPGGLLWTRYGKGTFVYTGLAFFRQLPAGVPGAFRLFANLLAGAR
jgi:LmbE family N-acetylglucosaminyl deacetylase